MFDVTKFKTEMEELSVDVLVQKEMELHKKILGAFTLQDNLPEITKQLEIISDVLKEKRNSTNG